MVLRLLSVVNVVDVVNVANLTHESVLARLWMHIIWGLQGRLRHPAPALMTGAPRPVPVYTAQKINSHNVPSTTRLCPRQ